MIRSLLLASLILFVGVAASAQSVISNVRSAQVPGTHRIKITYDVAPGSTCTTALQASLDGEDITIPPEAIIVASSQLGPGMSGSGLTIQVDASKVPALKNLFTKNLRFKVVASNSATDGFALIPAGNFQMGDATGVGGSDELPIHTVYVSEFYMAKHEVTKALWDEVRTWGLANGYTDLSTGDGKAANHPVYSVNWWDVVKWCNARSERDGLTPCYTVSEATYKTGNSNVVVCNWSANGYRLPTEAEWEKAARGGLSGQNFPWGNTISHNQANYFSHDFYSYDVSLTRGYHPDYTAGDFFYTSPVGSFAPNGYGLYDMAGNIFEWCWDWHGSYAAGSQADPRGPSSGTGRVQRGGGWYFLAINCRVAFRASDTPGSTITYYGFGFRPARSSVP